MDKTNPPSPSMSAATATAAAPISLALRVGARDAPRFVDVRKAEAFAESEYFLPGSLRWDYHAGALMPNELRDTKRAIAYCVKGAEVGINGAALLSQQNIDATYLQGGLRDWQATGLLAVKKRPELGVDGERVSRWVTRARPKIDRIACPWLIRRFIDPRAEFFYVPKEVVFEFAKANNAVAYDIPGAPLEHACDGERCSFDAFIKAFELKSPTLDRVANVVRAADTDTLDRAREAAGLLAISLGFSNMIEDDHAMLSAMLPVYDALYEWAIAVEDKSVEHHSWTPA
jgi:rhodanese-related sulfurtransferase